MRHGRRFDSQKAYCKTMCFICLISCNKRTSMQRHDYLYGHRSVQMKILCYFHGNNINRANRHILNRYDPIALFILFPRKSIKVPKGPRGAI